MSETTEVHDVEGPDTCDVLLDVARTAWDGAVIDYATPAERVRCIVAALLRTLDEFVRGAEDDDELWPEGGDLAIIADQVDGGMASSVAVTASKPVPATEDTGGHVPTAQIPDASADGGETG